MHRTRFIQGNVKRGGCVIYFIYFNICTENVLFSSFTFEPHGLSIKKLFSWVSYRRVSHLYAFMISLKLREKFLA